MVSGAGLIGPSSFDRWLTTPSMDKPDAPADELETPTPCGGCGETNPRRRCLGCMHPFTPDDWPTKRKEVER